MILTSVIGEDIPMNHILRSLFTWLLLLTAIGYEVCYAEGSMTSSLAPMLQKVLPSVVNIRAQIKITDMNLLNKIEKETNQNPNSNNALPDKLLSVGSGVIVDAANGYILTNAHVVDEAETVIVTLGDGHHYTAKVIGLDKASDVGLLQIKAKGLTAITFGNSNNLQVGDRVAAIGNPFGLSQTVTSGIVSALGRTTGIENYENFIQTDAPINPGNSGGALIDMQGQMVGINTAILAPSRGSVGIGFAIPSNMAKSVMQQLIQYGNVRRGMLGVGAQDITPELAAAFKLQPNTKGAVVTQVILGSPAEKAGIQVGDIITHVNNTLIKNANDVVNAIGLIRVDSKTDITILRQGKSLALSVILTDPQKRKEQGKLSDPFLYGVALKNFSLVSPIHGDVKGVLVVSVDQDTNAWHSDLRPGDVITSANQQPVNSITELKKVAADNKEDLLLNVLRGAGAVFIVINQDS